jgi:hypothetical protein
MDFIGFFMFSFLIAAVGFVVGGKCEAHRWRENADRIWRIESAGQLFKVFHDDNKPQS